MVDPSWNSVRGMLSTSLLWGRFWCSRTIQIWSKVIPYCDNSAEKIDMSNRRHGGSWVEPLPISEKIEQVRGLSVPNPYHCATDASSLDGDIWSTLHPPAYMAWKTCWNNNKRTKQTEGSFTSVQMVHTHTHLDIHYWQRDDLFSSYHCWKCMKMHCAEAKSFGKLSLKLRSL